MLIQIPYLQEGKTCLLNNCSFGFGLYSISMQSTFPLIHCVLTILQCYSSKYTLLSPIELFHKDGNLVSMPSNQCPNKDGFREGINQVLAHKLRHYW